MTVKDHTLLTIREFSRLTHTPIDTLKHYDRMALLKPAYVGENRYRYYRPEQALQLTRILFGVRAKAHLSDIKSLMEEEDPQRAIGQYREIYAGLEQRVQELAAMQQAIRNLLYYFSIYQEHPAETFFSVYFPECFILLSEKLDINSSSGNEADIANELFLKGFYHHRWPHFLLGALYEAEDVRARSFAAPAYFLKVDHPEQYDAEETRYIPAGTYICYLYRTQAYPLPAAARRYVEESGAAGHGITGELFAMHVVSSLITVRPEAHYTMLMARRQGEPASR